MDIRDRVPLSVQLVLASASPARLSVLRAAGVRPVVQASTVDEDALIASAGSVPPGELVTVLARAKAADAAAGFADAVVVGCDSMLHIGGELVGKPHTVDIARERWAAMAGNSAELLTGRHRTGRGDQRILVHSGHLYRRLYPGGLQHGQTRR